MGIYDKREKPKKKRIKLSLSFIPRAIVSDGFSM